MKDKYIKALGCCFAVLSGIIMVLVILFCLSLLVGCARTIYVPVEKVHTVEKTDTLTRYERDSVFVNQYSKGDTVFRIKYVERWRERERIRNVIVRDSIPIPYDVPVYINKLTDFQKWQIRTFWVCVLFIIGGIFVAIRKWYKKLRHPIG